MKKYETTKKFPFELDKEYQLMPGCIEAWLEKGWIKEVKKEVWIIDKFDNWKLIKYEKAEGINNEYVEIFKSKKKALKFVLDEAKKRFDGTKEVYHPIRKYHFYVKSEDLYINNNCEIYNDSNTIWHEKFGWIVESIKTIIGCPGWSKIGKNCKWHDLSENGCFHCEHHKKFLEQ